MLTQTPHYDFLFNSTKSLFLTIFIIGILTKAGIQNYGEQENANIKCPDN